MADLTIVIDVRQLATGELQTMSSYKIPNSDKLTFKNASTSSSLKITAKDDSNYLPICENNQPIALPLTIGPNGSKTVKICSDFNGQEFLYTAQIGQSNAEDPIVIIERPKLNFAFDSTSFILGAAIAAAATYLILKSRAGKSRPQQG